MSEERFNSIDSKLDNINTHLSNIDITLASQNESLKYHIKRTDMLEDHFKPIQSHIDGLNGIVKFLKILAILAGLAGGLYQLIHWIK